jgi:hypothetical protein
MRPTVAAKLPLALQNVRDANESVWERELGFIMKVTDVCSHLGSITSQQSAQKATRVVLSIRSRIAKGRKG